MKPNSGGVPTVRRIVLAESSGPTGAPSHGMVGVSSSSPFSFSVVSASCSRSSLSWASSSACAALSSARLASSAWANSLAELFRRRLGLVQFVLQLADGPVEVEQFVDV